MEGSFIHVQNDQIGQIKEMYELLRYCQMLQKWFLIREHIY